MQGVRFEKAPLDIRVYGLDFYQFAELIGGDTISSGTMDAAAGITVQTPTVSTTKVLFQVSGGTANVTYRLKVSANMLSGAVLEGFADIAVLEPVSA